MLFLGSADSLLEVGRESRGSSTLVTSVLPLFRPPAAIRVHIKPDEGSPDRSILPRKKRARVVTKGPWLNESRHYVYGPVSSRCSCGMGCGIWISKFSLPSPTSPKQKPCLTKLNTPILLPRGDYWVWKSSLLPVMPFFPQRARRNFYQTPTMSRGNWWPKAYAC